MAGFGKSTTVKKTPKFDGKKTFSKQMRAFSKLRAKGSEVSDIYVHQPGAEKFWFVGKVAVRHDTIGMDAAIATQKRLIFEHGKLLQLELKVASELEIWRAPGNSEVSVAQHQYGLTAVEMAPLRDEAAAEAFASGNLIKATLCERQV